MASSEPKRYTDAYLYDYAGSLLALSAPTYDPAVVRAMFVRLRELIAEARKRKGRSAHRPRTSDIGEMVEARKKEFGGSVTKARMAVAAETGHTVKAVGQAHRRWLSKYPASLPG